MKNNEARISSTYSDVSYYMDTKITTSLDEVADVLYVTLTSPTNMTYGEMDEEEVIVIKEHDTNKIVGFSVPFYKYYWLNNIDKLISHLDNYIDTLGGLNAKLYGHNSSTENDNKARSTSI